MLDVFPRWKNLNKFHTNINQKKARASQGKGLIYRDTINYCENEVRPILELLRNKNTSETIKNSLRKFLIISLVSTFEFYFKNMARYYVDKNAVDLTKLFKDELCFKLSDLDELLKDNLLTRGNIVVSSIHFDDLNQINNFVSRLLDINLFKYLYEENTKDKCKMMIKNAPPIDINYKNLLKAFELRHAIVHEQSDVPYSYTHILKLWDNAMNIFDIANTVFTSPLDLRRYRIKYGKYRGK